MLGVPTTSLGRKIALAVGIPVLAGAVIGVGLSWRAALRAARSDAVEEASALADLVATSFTLADPGQRGDREAHRAVAAALQTDWKLVSRLREVRVVDRDGVIRWSRRVEEQGQRLPGFDLDMLQVPRGRELEGGYVLPLGGASCATCHRGDSLHLGAVQLVLDRPRRLTEVDDIYRFTMGGTVALALLFLVAVSFASRHFVTRPLVRLKQAMERAKSGDFLVRVAVESGDEIGDLARGFNSMLARITELKVAEIETGRDLERMQRELLLKAELEAANRRLEGTVRELQLLFELTRSMSSTLELEPLLNRVSERVGSALGYQEFSVMLFDRQKGDLTQMAGFGAFGGERLRFRVGEGAAGQAAQTLQVVYVEDVEKDARYVRRAQERGSLLCVPMVFKEQLVGVLNFRKPEVANFGPDEERLLRSVANQAAMAIVNARLYQETVELSQTDALTGCHNRRHLFARLEMEVTRAQRFGTPLSAVMIDIDHFKHLNDTNGHPAGDRVLKEVADLLKKQLRKVDILARYGGEEFFVVLPQNQKLEAVEVAEKLRRAVERTPFPEGEKQPLGCVTISVGVASHPQDGSTLEALVDSVDSALYASKRRGRNKVSAYEPGMEDHPGRERGPKAQQRKKPSGEIVLAAEALEGVAAASTERKPQS